MTPTIDSIDSRRQAGDAFISASVVPGLDSSVDGLSAAVAPSAQALLDVVISILDDHQAQDVVTIPLAGKSGIADFMVVASGRSSTHVSAVADYLQRGLKNAKMPAYSVAGLPMADWVVVDASDVIVHLFRPEVRDFYQLEKMWDNAFITSESTEDNHPLDSASSTNE